MGHRSGSLVWQVKERYDSLLGIGRSKHADKIAGVSGDYIYSWDTYRSYVKHANYFVAWCKSNYSCKTLADCKPYAAAWMETRSTLSPYTQKLEVSALAKLYGCSAADLGVKTESVSRAAIKRSRGDAKRDRNFSETKNAMFVEFCRSVGCRRAELEQLRGTDLVMLPGWDGIRSIHFCRGTKGGRERYAIIVGDIALVARVCAAAGSERILPYIYGEHAPSGADIHSYRADYATRVYKLFARPIEELHGRDAYFMRGDRKGEVLDRNAMYMASEALGHSRVSVIAEHYLRFDD